MTWFLYALLCAFFLATSDVFAKKALQSVDEYVVSWGRLVWAAPFLLCLLPFMTVPAIKPLFWVALMVLIPVEITTIVLYVKAIKTSPLSITTPFLGLTPVFLIGTSFLILGERPDASGYAGIALVAIGTYALNLRQAKHGLLAPIRAIGQEHGSLLMVIVALLYSVTSILGKICAQSSSPAFFGIIYVIITPICLFPIVCINSSVRAIRMSFGNRNFVFLGFFYGLMVLFHLLAIVQTEVTYMIAVKRTSLLFSVIYGGLLFGEAQIRERFAAGTIMIAGIVCIAVI